MDTQNKKRKINELNNIDKIDVINQNIIDNNNEIIYNYDIKNEFNEIFFDDASKYWNKNKIKMKNGTYLYKCMAISKKNGKECYKPSHKKYNDFCFLHRKRAVGFEGKQRFFG